MSRFIPPKFAGLTDKLGLITQRRTRDIYVLLSKDGSTLIKDPGLSRPWFNRNKMLAESTAAEYRKQGVMCYATDFETALVSVLKHPKNQPPKKDA